MKRAKPEPRADRVDHRPTKPGVPCSTQGGCARLQNETAEQKAHRVALDGLRARRAAKALSAELAKLTAELTAELTAPQAAKVVGRWRRCLAGVVERAREVADGGAAET